MTREFLENAKESLISYLEKMEKDWWLEIVTEKPNCTYYFGPFVSQRAAQFASCGYLKDLEQERPQMITLTIKQCQPEKLTIFEEIHG